MSSIPSTAVPSTVQTKILNKTPGHSWKKILGKNAQPRLRSQGAPTQVKFAATPADSKPTLRHSNSSGSSGGHNVDPNLLATVGPKKKNKTNRPVSRHTRIAQNQKEQELLAKKQTHQTINYLQRKTHFDSSQVRALLEIYRSLTGLGKFDRLRFRETLHHSFGLIDPVMLDRVFASFDGDNEGSVSESEWVIGLSVMLRGTLDEQIAYCYEVYDVNGDQAIGRDELQTCLRGCLYPIPGEEEDADDLEEGSREIVELAMKKLDIDHDGFIKYGDFYNACHNDPILLQAIGPCLPRNEDMMTFISLFDNNHRSFNAYLSHPTDPSWERERDKFNPEIAEKIRKKFKIKTKDNMKLMSIFKRGNVNSLRGMRFKDSDIENRDSLI